MSVLKRLYSLPEKLDNWLRWRDLRFHRVDHGKRWFPKGYSQMALWLPIPLLVAVAYGSLRWRDWPLAVVCLAAVAALVLACRFFPKVRGCRVSSGRCFSSW